MSCLNRSESIKFSRINCLVSQILILFMIIEYTYKNVQFSASASRSYYYYYCLPKIHSSLFIKNALKMHSFEIGL